MWGKCSSFFEFQIEFEASGADRFSSKVSSFVTILPYPITTASDQLWSQLKVQFVYLTVFVILHHVSTLILTHLLELQMWLFEYCVSDGWFKNRSHLLLKLDLNSKKSNCKNSLLELCFLFALSRFLPWIYQLIKK